MVPADREERFAPRDTDRIAGRLQAEKRFRAQDELRFSGGGNVFGVGEAYQGEFDKVFSHDKPDMDRRDWKNHRIAVGAGA